jgi:hypothetical protein
MFTHKDEYGLSSDASFWVWGSVRAAAWSQPFSWVDWHLARQKAAFNQKPLILPFSTQEIILYRPMEPCIAETHSWTRVAGSPLFKASVSPLGRHRSIMHMHHEHRYTCSCPRRHSSSVIVDDAKLDLPLSIGTDFKYLSFSWFLSCNVITKGGGGVHQ